jgi:thymidylate synthase
MENLNNISNNIIDLIEAVRKHGEISQPRNLKVFEGIYGHINVNPSSPFANFKDREFNWRYFAGELAWYLKCDRDISYINKFSSFWKGITNPGTNEINSNYGSLIFNDQLKWCLDSLKADINTRQAIALLNQPKFQYEGNKDFVCTMYLNFFIRDNKLNMKVQMRSNDIFYGLTFDAPFFAFVHQHMLLWLKETYPKLTLGRYDHFSDNIHYYERHFDLVDSILTNGISDNQYIMRLDKPFFTVSDGFKYTEMGFEFINEVDSLVTSKENADQKNRQEQYLNLLSKYLNIEPWS